MPLLFAVALELSPAAWVATIVSVVGFLVMFGISSAKGDFQGLIKTTLANDQAMRKNRSSRKGTEL